MPDTEPKSADPSELEARVRGLWQEAGLPPPDGRLGGPDGPRVLQVLGGFAPGDSPLQTLARAVRADVDARYLVLSGHRVVGTHRRVGDPDPTSDAGLGGLLRDAGVWTGGTGARPWDETERSGRVQLLIERLAAHGVLEVRSGAARLCFHCAAARSPERTVYQEKVGDTFLVRFPLGGPNPPGELLAWVDAPWRLLGATALLVNPDLRYVVAEYRRDGAKARLVLSRSALPRLEQWLPGGRFDEVGELRGRDLEGRPYLHPLRHEFPLLGALEAPAGTVHAVPEVGDSGTGVVPLVPSHGGSDLLVAERLHVSGPSLLTTRGLLDPALAHKYSGLELPVANDFVQRDLSDAGAVLARLRVLRGVPYCGVCGRSMVWAPGRAWWLRLARLPPELAQLYSRLLPSEPPLKELELTPWPVSDTLSEGSNGSFRLSECDRCERLDPPTAVGSCSCGGARAAVARRLLPAFAGALGAWAARDGDGGGEEWRLYLSERRRSAALVHHAVALASLDTPVQELSLTVVPSLPEADPVEVLRDCGADALRASLVRGGASSGGGPALLARARQEGRRLARLRTVSESVERPNRSTAAGRTTTNPEVEDRLLLARWWEVEAKAIAEYDAGRPAEALRRIDRFVDLDLERFRSVAAARLSEGSASPSGVAAHATLGRVLVRLAAALAPVAPFTAESIRAALRPDDPPLFSGTPLEDEPPTPDHELLVRGEEWDALLGSLARFRGSQGLPPDATLARVALTCEEEATGNRLRADRERLETLGRVGQLEIASPERAWSGKLQRLVPVEEEVAKAYPSIAPQVLHLLRRLPPRGATGGDPSRDVSVVVGGLPRPISPAMVKVTEELPEGFVRFPSPLGELLVLPEELAAADALPADRGRTPRSVDASWVARRLAQRVRAYRRAGVDPSDSAAVLHLPDPLAAEMDAAAEPLAREIGVREVRVDGLSGAVVGAQSVRGRTRLGARWWVDLVGLPPLSRPRKLRAASSGGRVVVLPDEQEDPEETVDFLDPELLAREEGIRALSQGLEELLAVPAFGPSKSSYAWDAGWRTVPELVGAPFETVASLPGFGREATAVVYERAGRPVPPRRPSVVPAPDEAHVVRIPRVGPDLGAADATTPRSPRPSPVEAATSARGDLSSSGKAAGSSETPAAEHWGVELDASESPAAALLPFLRATARGDRGFAVAKESYERIRSLLGRRTVDLRRWGSGGGPTELSDSDLAALTGTVLRALTEDGARAVYLEGVERLVEHHGLDAVLHFLREVDRVASERRAWVCVRVREEHLVPEETERLEQAFPSGTDGDAESDDPASPDPGG